MRVQPVLFAALLAGGFMSSGANAAVSSYNITPLFSPAGTIDVYAKGVNSAGQIAGYTVDSNGLNRAVTWNAAGDMTTLPLPAGFTSSTANRLNSLGQIVGDASFDLPDGSGSVKHAMLWQTDGHVVDLGTVDGKQFATALDINDSGNIVGTASAAHGQHAVGWSVDASDHVTLTDFGSYEPTSNLQFAGFNSINNAGKMGGTAYRLFTPYNAVIMTDRGITNISPPGQFSTGMVLGISENGTVVGYQNHPGTSPHAAIFDEVGGAQDLGTLYGLTDSWAQDINSDGIISGTSFGGDDDGNLFSYSFVYVDGQMYDLATLLNNGDGWTQLYEAAGINDDGLIVGTGTFNGEFHAYTLSPAGAIPEPAGLMLALPALTLLARRRR